MRRFRLGLGVLCFGSAFAAIACGSSGGGAGAGPDASPGDDASTPADSSTAPDATTPGEASIDDGSDGASEATSPDAGAESGVAPPADSGAETGAGDAGAESGVAPPADSGAETGAGDAGGGDADAGPAAVPLIVVDQLGYRPSDTKIAVVRGPQIGFDATAFTPGPTYAVVDSTSGTKVFEGAPVAWNAGATDPSSGDEAWWFDFSGVTTPGTYYVLDEASSTRSPVFAVKDDVYAGALVQAVRTFFYQRDGIAKPLSLTGNAAWTDIAAHPQDAQCALYSAPDASAPVDLHGGWFDAGDQSKYTIWAASNAIDLLRAYAEAPGAFAVTTGDAGVNGDGYGIPESGNGTPDVLDEARWGLDWLGRMQRGDGSVLSLVGAAGASPPSADTSPCLYGPASTAATWSAAAAFAYGAIVFQSWDPGYSTTLRSEALGAWSWASSNPGVTFSNAGIIGTYEQEPDATGLTAKELQAALFLFELTGDSAYQQVIDADYQQIESSDPSDIEAIDTLLDYARNPGATGSVAASIQATFLSNVGGASVAGMVPTDPYLAYIPSYAFNVALGSNQPKIGQGNMFYDVVSFQVGDAGVDAGPGVPDAAVYAEGYVHYLHGVNPLGLVYLSNMGAFGATRSLTQIFSQWFSSDLGIAPPPGFIAGGPNPAYTWDVCCPTGCGSDANDALCGAAPLAPPARQPAQKSYRDFGAAWPLDSWQVSEANDAYMAQYVRLVSKFVP